MKVSLPRRVRFYLAASAAALITVFFIALFSADRAPSHAAGGGKPKASPLYNDNEPYQPARTWNGCGFGVNGGGVIGRITDGGPVGMDSDAMFGGVHLRCALQAGLLVIGAEASHAWNWGDMHDLGINRDLSVVGKVGAVVLPNTQFYVGGGWSRIGLGESFGVAHVDGWKLIAGTEFKLQSSMPLFLDVRYEYGMYDIKDLAPPTVDASTHAIRVGLTYQFGTMGLGSASRAASK